MQPTTVQIGYLDKNGHPTVKITVHGVLESHKQEFEAMIDTGFTGFLMMPLLSAFPLALTLLGTSSYMLADGTVSPKLLAFGTVTLDGEQTNGTIVLEGNQCGLLLGMDFLRRAKRALVVHENGVLLVQEEFVKQFGQAFSKAAGVSESVETQDQPPSIDTSTRI